ncbi:MAG: nicotinamide-nucleotide amidohydrolase family protein, partial [Acetivibrio ethanolgignens]
SRQRIIEYFKGREDYTRVAENNWRQAEVIEGCIVVDNKNGIAPGEIIELPAGKRLILMPGPPNELKPMFRNDIGPYLAKLQEVVLYSEMVKVCGIGESMAETMVLDLIEGQENPTIAPYAKTAEVHFRVTARAASEEEGKQLVAPVVEELKKRFGDNVYTTKEEESLEEVVISLLKQQRKKIATAESITGGLIAATLINVPGASSVVDESFVTYSNEAKHKRLGVKEETLKSYGAVSEQTAKEMAEGICQATGADVGIAVTGIAGPDGGTPEKPVGLVYVGCCVEGKCEVEELRLKGNRQKIRDMVVVRALDFIRRGILQ